MDQYLCSTRVCRYNSGC